VAGERLSRAGGRATPWDCGAMVPVAVDVAGLGVKAGETGGVLAAGCVTWEGVAVFAAGAGFAAASVSGGW
jgi:hypothetical protein